MKTILYTQRVDIIKSYGERRDCADQRIPEFLSACGYLPVPVSNLPELALAIARKTSPGGIFLTGGNSLAKYGGDAPERDATETALVNWAVSKGIPVFGICRGLQFLADFYGGTIASLEGHVATRHAVQGVISRKEVNSYHGLGVREVPRELEVLSRAGDGSIEALRQQSQKVMAVGWHPEREEAFDEEDIRLVRELFGKEE